MSAGDLIALRRAYALVCPNICAGTQGPQGPPGDLSTNPVASYYSTATQPISSTGTTIWTLNQTVVERSISVVGGSQITVSTSGIYEVYYSAQIHRTAGGSPVYIYVWLKKNGADEPQTNGRISVNSNNGDSLPIVPYIIQLNAGDYIEFASRASDTDCQILAVDPAAVGPAIPSLIVGIKRIG